MPAAFPSHPSSLTRHFFVCSSLSLQHKALTIVYRTSVTSADPSEFLVIFVLFVSLELQDCFQLAMDRMEGLQIASDSHVQLLGSTQRPSGVA